MLTRMPTGLHRKALSWSLIGVLLGIIPPAEGETAPETTQPAVPVAAEREQAEPTAETEPALSDKPFSVAVTYYLLSDYVFRGVNFSEYAPEGREKPNHQMTMSLDIPLGPQGRLGTFGFDTFFEWYAAQEQLGTTPPGGSNLQEIDFTLRYSYNFDRIKTKATVGWTEYTYPRLIGPHDRTNEWFVRFDHNDAWMWRGLGYRGEEGILNPSFLFAQDTGFILGQWYEISISHPFTLAKNLTWTPKCIFAFDGGYIQPALNAGHGSGQFEYAYTQPGMDLRYDLTELLRLPPWAGSVYISGLLYYNIVSDVEKNRNRASNLVLQDVLFGGMAVGWSW